MAIRVECYGGYRGEQEPLALWLGGRRLAVGAVVDRWFAPGSAGLKSMRTMETRTYFDTTRRAAIGKLPRSAPAAKKAIEASLPCSKSSFAGSSATA